MTGNRAVAAGVADARRAERDARRKGYFESTGRLFAVGAVDEGLAEVARGIELDRDDPTGHLVAAAGLASARCLTSFVTGADDCFAANNRLYKCVRGLASLLIRRLPGKSAFE